jgi:hypothetical protein
MSTSTTETSRAADSGDKKLAHQDAVQILEAIHSLVEAAASATPHKPPAYIIVTCGEDKAAFGRTALMQMGYDVSILETQRLALIS